jgi:hypothetical protein
VIAGETFPASAKPNPRSAKVLRRFVSSQAILI